ncbi:MAG: GGDEF domain-containing protein [Thermoleophilaceae bacterium]|nr:GGDEF domain-containing protein [Thermoleophilaceae bacterium]
MEETVETAVSQHAVGESQGSAPAGDHQNVLRLEGAADVNAELAEIGLSNKSGWYASILLYGAGGIVTLLAGLLRPEIVPLGVRYLACFAILLSILSAVGARYLTNADWATHLRLFFGLAIFGIGAVVAGPLRTAFIMLPLFVLITPTFLYGARFAIPYVSVITPLAVLVVLVTDQPARIAHAVVSGGALMMVVLSFMAAEHRTRSLARSNRRLAYTDPLTDIANTRRLRETLAFALGNGERFALYAIDLDNFKLVNDTFDHTTGDAVLCAVAEALESEVGADDLVARRGGDEFSVLIMHPAGVDLDRLSERLGKAIERGRMATCPSITPSGSVAYVLSEESDSISSVLQRADDNLHASKQAFHSEHGDREAMRAKLESEENLAEIRPRVTSREAALRSVSAAVSRAYSRRRPGQLRQRMEKLTKRANDWARGLDFVWGYVAATCISIGLFWFLLSAAGALSPLPPAVGMGFSAVLIAIGGFALHAAKARVNKRWIDAVFIAMIASVSVIIAFAGSAGAALIDVYVVFALYGFYFLRPRQALAGMLICCGLFVGFALTGGYPYAGIRSAVTLAVVLVAAAIVVKVRSVTLRFVRTNRELSEVDALTGVANLRALRLRVDDVLDKHSGESAAARPMLMTVDLDRFKQVNDRYNHTTGDQVLGAVARAISECVRIDEMVARRGGDEFFVLFDSSTPEHLESVIPRVHKAVAHARERICPDLTPTASVGYLAWEPGQNADQFLAAADGIMHDEKIDTRSRDYEQVA